MASAEDHTLVVVGSGGVGKSCLTVRFLKDEFSSEYDPTVEENYRKTVTIDNVSCVMNIVDTAGQQEFTALRDQHLMTGEGFLLVFAINDKTTFQEVLQLRESVINLKDTSKVPFVIVGNKCDIQEGREISRADVEAAIPNVKIPYIETSAKNNINVHEAYHELVREVRKVKGGNVAKSSPKEESKGCCILM